MAEVCIPTSHTAFGARVGALKETLAGSPLRLSGSTTSATPAFANRTGSGLPSLKCLPTVANKDTSDERSKEKSGFAKKAHSQKIVASPNAASDGGAKLRPVKAVATAPPTVTETRQSPGSPAREPKTVTLTIFTGGENNSGMYGDARVSFVSTDGKLAPSPDETDATALQKFIFEGPFKKGENRAQDFEIPGDFDVAGVIVDNPKATRLDRFLLGKLADKLNFDVPVIGINPLLTLTSLTGLNWITNGDWYVRRLELAPTGNSGDPQKLPLYGWIEESTQRIAFEGTPYLPQDTPPGLGKWRRGSLVNNQSAYNYQPYNDLSKPPSNKNFWDPNHRLTLDPYPQHLAEDREGPNAGKIPQDERFGLSKRTDFDVGTIKGILNTIGALLYDGTIRVSIGRSIVLGALAGVVIGWLADKGVTEEFLASVDAFLNGLIPPGPLKALLGGLPESIVLAVLAKRLFNSAISGAALGALIGALAGNEGPEVAGIVAGLVGFLATAASLVGGQINTLAFETVDAYVTACFDHDTYLGPLKIGYDHPFVYKLGLDDPENPKKAWDSDYMFGWQAVAGINPESITLVESEERLLATKTITAEDLAAVKKELPDFERELKEKRIFMIDYSAFEGFRADFNKNFKKNGKFLYAPVTILHQTDANDKVPIPIAIKLSQDPDPKNVIITPGRDASKDKWGWKSAKAIAASANAGVHQLVQHFLRTHAVCETYAIAMRRQLSEVHPLFKLLINHTRYTMDINNRARASLINAGGVIESTFSPGPQAMAASAAFYQSWRFETQNPKTDLERRRVLDAAALPNYPYRDHSLAVWGALEEYVRDYVSLYYKDHTDIARDYELQAFWADVKRGAQSLDTWLKAEKSHENPSGLPWPKLETIDDLVTILSTIIWSGSAMHALVNFGQYDYSGFVPNAPASIRCPFKFEKLANGGYTEQDFMASMPKALEMTTVMTVVETLVDHSVEEQYLGWNETEGPGKEYADEWLTDPEAANVYKKFVDHVSAVQKKLDTLNDKAQAHGGVKYFYLLPNPRKANYAENIPAQGVPNSVTI